MSHDKLTNIELGVLQELVWNVIDTLQTSGDDRADNPTFVAYCNLYRKLRGTPPAPHSEDEISPAPRESGISLADDFIDLARNAGKENE